MSIEHGVWVMPEWMEPYRPMIRNTGGNSVEDLVNDQGTTAHNNLIRSVLIISVQDQVALMAELHAQGRLS